METNTVGKVIVWAEIENLKRLRLIGNPVHGGE
jgi:hypothetical protein